jgi:RND family efflux transporter MFP subunit
MIKKIIIGVVSLAVVAGIGMKGRALLMKRRAEVNATAIPQKDTINIPVVQATQGDIIKSQKYLAVVAFDKSIKVSTKMAGYIKKLYVNEGDRVKKGTVVAKIDDQDINSNIALLKTTLIQQKNDYALAKQIYNRNLKLYKIGGLPKEQLDTSRVIMEGKKTAILATKQKIAQLQDQKKYLDIKAPFDGIVDTIILYGGDLAVTGKPIFTMSSGVKKLVFNFTLEKDAIKKGQKVFYKGENIGEIKLIKSVAKAGLAQAEVSLDKELNIPVGSSINIEVITQKASGCIIPNDTLIHKKDGLYIMVYRGEKFEPLKVEKVLDNDEDTIISSCPKEKIAIGNETKLSQLGAYNRVDIIKQ